MATGADQPFDFKRSHGCGQLAGSKNLLLHRSATLGYFDLSRVGAPGISALAARLVPDASAGCTCSYQNHTWTALEGM